VEWFNQVDLTYRNDLRTLNDTNFARFEAVLDARFAGADARLVQRFAGVDARFAELDVRFAQMESRFAQLELRLEARFARVELSVQRALAQQLRWMIGLWITTMLGIVAVLVTVVTRGS
jgi:hypothetical protein